MLYEAVHQDVLDNINKNKIISQEDEMILKQELKIFLKVDAKLYGASSYSY